MTDSPDTLQADLDAAFAPAARAVHLGAIPCAALGVVTADGRRARALAGFAQRVPEPVPLRPAHFFDLASLTKVILTTTEIIRAAQDGLLDFDDPLARHIPDMYQYDTAHRLRAITLLECLTHTAGLPAVEPIYTWGTDPAALQAHVLQRAWPLGAAVYSDIGFILLGIVLERVRGTQLRGLIRGEGLAAAPPAERAVATEACRWRGRVLRGEVHDENACALGGLAGHAGLFGTLDGVLGFAQTVLSGADMNNGGRNLLFRAATPTRSLGWQVAHPGWSGGSLCSPDTIGHTGFTGTGLWIDRTREYAWALLTNRVHPSRHQDTGITGLRQAVGNRLASRMCKCEVM